MTTRKRKRKEKCAICLEEKEEPALVKLSSCQHMYCQECIEEWCKRENTCPQCKKRITFLTIPGRKRRKRVKRVDLRSEDELSDTTTVFIGNTLMQYVQCRNFRRLLAENLLFHPTAGIVMIWHIIQQALPSLNQQVRNDIDNDIENISQLTLDVMDANEAMIRLRQARYAAL